MFIKIQWLVTLISSVILSRAVISQISMIDRNLVRFGYPPGVNMLPQISARWSGRLSTRWRNSTNLMAKIPRFIPFDSSLNTNSKIHYYLVFIRMRSKSELKIQSTNDFLNHYRSDAIDKYSLPQITELNISRAASKNVPWHVTLAFTSEEFQINGRNASRRFVWQRYADGHVSYSSNSSVKYTSSRAAAGRSNYYWLMVLAEERSAMENGHILRVAFQLSARSDEFAEENRKEDTDMRLLADRIKSIRYETESSEWVSRYNAWLSDLSLEGDDDTAPLLPLRLEQLKLASNKLASSQWKGPLSCTTSNETGRIMAQIPRYRHDYNETMGTFYYLAAHYQPNDKSMLISEYNHLSHTDNENYEFLTDIKEFPTTENFAFKESINLSSIQESKLDNVTYFTGETSAEFKYRNEIIFAFPDSHFTTYDDRRSLVIGDSQTSSSRDHRTKYTSQLNATGLYRLHIIAQVYTENWVPLEEAHLFGSSSCQCIV